MPVRECDRSLASVGACISKMQKPLRVLTKRHVKKATTFDNLTMTMRGLRCLLHVGRHCSGRGSSWLSVWRGSGPHRRVCGRPLVREVRSPGLYHDVQNCSTYSCAMNDAIAVCPPPIL